MGRKTSVYLADDILAALAKDPRPLAEVIRAGLGISDQAVDVYRALVNVTRFEVIDGRISDGARTLVAYDVEVTASLQDDARTLKIFLTDRDQGSESDPVGDVIDRRNREAGQRLMDAAEQLEGQPIRYADDDEPTVGRGRTAAQVDQLLAHGGEIILAESGEPEPEPDLGPRIIKLGGEDA